MELFMLLITAKVEYVFGSIEISLNPINSYNQISHLMHLLNLFYCTILVERGKTIT